MSHPLDLATAMDWIQSEVHSEFAREVGEAVHADIEEVEAAGGYLLVRSSLISGVAKL